MRNPAADPQNLQMTDFWCYFCRRPWTEDVPMIEGHQGSLICGRCLALAYADLALHNAPSIPAATDAPGAPRGVDESRPKCLMCLEHRRDPLWRSPAHETLVCLRCVKQGATALEKDPDYGWKRPTA